MKRSNWLQRLISYPPIISVARLQLEGELDANSARSTASRLARAGHLERIGKGLYLNRVANPTVADLLLAVQPSYFSCLTALVFRSVLLDRIYVYEAITTERPRQISTSVASVRFYHVKESLFFGYTRETFEGREVLMAEPEKALLDWIYINKKRGIKLDTREIGTLKLSQTRLQNYARKFPLPLEEELTAICGMNALGF